MTKQQKYHSESYNEEDEFASSLRIINNVRGPSPVNVYIENILIFSNIDYEDVTAYRVLKSGTYKLDIRRTSDDTQLTARYIRLKKDKMYTGILVGGIDDPFSIELTIFNDGTDCPRPGTSNLRFINGAFTSQAVDVYLDAKAIFQNVMYMQTGTPEYYKLNLGQPIPGGFKTSYNVEIKMAGTDSTIIGPFSLYPVSGGIYTIISSNSTNGEFTYISTRDNIGQCEVVQEDFDIDAYMGKWYEIASIPQQYEPNKCKRVTAEYTLMNDGVNVYNVCYDRDWNVISSITGKAILTKPCGTGSLIVEFPDQPLPPDSLPNYVVHATDYENYSLIGTPTRSAFYILSRTSTICVNEYLKFRHYAGLLGYAKQLLQPNYHTVTRKGCGCNDDNNKNNYNYEKSTYNNQSNDNRDMNEDKYNQNKSFDMDGPPYDGKGADISSDDKKYYHKNYHNYKSYEQYQHNMSAEHDKKDKHQQKSNRKENHQNKHHHKQHNDKTHNKNKKVKHHNEGYKDLNVKKIKYDSIDSIWSNDVDSFKSNDSTIQDIDWLDGHHDIDWKDVKNILNDNIFDVNKDIDWDDEYNDIDWRDVKSKNIQKGNLDHDIDLYDKYHGNDIIDIYHDIGSNDKYQSNIDKDSWMDCSSNPYNKTKGQ